jgi:uncharacterized tellurite resistance protein B-like protein
MSLMNFTNILKLVRGEEPSRGESNELFKEVALMVLARATSADTNVKAVEVESVQKILNRVTGEEISIPDIRTAAASAVFEQKPLKKYLADVRSSLDSEERVRIIHCLAEVIHSDERISTFETTYFDMVAEALKATPSEIAGLVGV